MNTIEYFKERFDQWQPVSGGNGFGTIRQEAFDAFSRLGIPGSKNEEWKYTRVAGLFNKEYQFPPDSFSTSVTAKDLDGFRLPGAAAANDSTEFADGNGHRAASEWATPDATRTGQSVSAPVARTG